MFDLAAERQFGMERLASHLATGVASSKNRTRSETDIPVSGCMSQRCPQAALCVLSLSVSVYRQIHGALYSALMFAALMIGHRFSISTICCAESLRV
jgi:hypothetical protein